MKAGRLSIYDSVGKKNRTKIPNKKRKNKCVIYFIVIERREREGSCGVYDFYEEDAALSLASRTRASRESLHQRDTELSTGTDKIAKGFFLLFPLPNHQRQRKRLAQQQKATPVLFIGLSSP